MSDIVDETPETPEAAEVEAPEAEQETFQISRDDWGTLVGAVREMYTRQNQAPQQPVVEEEELDEDADLGDLIAQYVGREIEPLKAVAAKQQEAEGEKMLNGIFDQAEKHPEIGKFDRSIATRLSHTYFWETGIPMDDPRAAQAAQWAAIEGAKEAARIQREWTKQAVDEYKKSLKTQPFSDGPAAAGGERTPPSFKTMDEVTDHWESMYGQGAEQV